MIRNTVLQTIKSFIEPDRELTEDEQIRAIKEFPLLDENLGDFLKEHV